MGTKESGHRSAAMYTLVQSCRIIGVEPSAYLRDVLEHLPRLSNHQIADWIKIIQTDPLQGGRLCTAYAQSS